MRLDIAMQKKQKTQSKELANRNTFEAISEIPKGVAKSFGTDVIKGMTSDFWSQMLGFGETGQSNAHKAAHGDLAEGQELDLSKHSAKKYGETERMSKDREPGIDYRREILHGEKGISQENSREMQRQVQEILTELQRLVSSSQVLAVEFKEVSSTQRIVKPGKYHVSFFAWLLTIVRSARMKVEDSGAWLAMFKNKKSKQQYWGMFKKHGTNFGLSNERVVATQTG